MIERMSKQVSLNDPTAHFVLVPLMAQGHMIPMVDLARLLAERGVLATVITTPLNASRIQASINRARDSGLPIRLAPLPFPCAQVGLPEGCENIDVLPPGQAAAKSFFDAASLLGPPLEAYLRAQLPYPSCIISDSCHPWTLEVARRLRVPRLAFFSICCFTLLCEHNILHHSVYDTITDETEPYLVPALAHRVEVTKLQAPGFFSGPDYWVQIGEEVRAADRASDGVVVNSFYEMEPWYVDSYQKAMGTKVWVLGPLSLCNKQAADMAARGNHASIDKDRCLGWLDSMEPRSVVYVSFGSLTFTPPSQLIEIGLGLEASGRPFIWVIKEAENKSPEVERWLSEGGFEERTRSRSLIIKGWAPQAMILSHPAVGGFMTHCGWNSSFEAVSAGVPMITWPFFMDQFLNERMVVEVLQTGVGVGVKVPTIWGTAQDWVSVKREEVEQAVRRLMDEGGEGEGRRERARELGKKARVAMEVGGSSHDNLKLFIQSISKQASNGYVDEKEL